jgi:hypothetical protein
MITLTFILDQRTFNEIVTTREYIQSIYSALLTSKRCSCFHAYVNGIEVNLETCGVK